MLAADYPFLDLMWTMLVFFMWVIWFWILITVFADIFRRHDTSGFVKVLWMIFVIVLPFLGVLIYLIAEGQDMGRRDMEQSAAARAEFDAYIRQVASQPAPTGQGAPPPPTS